MYIDSFIQTNTLSGSLQIFNKYHNILETQDPAPMIDFAQSTGPAFASTILNLNLSIRTMRQGINYPGIADT